MYELSLVYDIACLLHYFHDAGAEVVLTLCDGQSSGSGLVWNQCVGQLKVGEAVDENVWHGTEQGIDFRASVRVSVERALVDELETVSADPEVLGAEVGYERVWLGQVVCGHETTIGPCFLVRFRGDSELVFSLGFGNVIACRLLVAARTVAWLGFVEVVLEAEGGAAWLAYVGAALLHVGHPCWSGAREIEGWSGSGWLAVKLPGVESSALEGIVVGLLPPPHCVAGLPILAFAPRAEQAEFLLTDEDLFFVLFLCGDVRCFVVAGVRALRTVDADVAGDGHAEKFA